MPRAKTATGNTTRNVGPTANQVLERLRNHEHVPDVILLALGLKQFTSEERGTLRMDVGYDAYTVDGLMGLAKGRKELRWGAAKLLVCRMLGYEPNIESYCRKEGLTPTDLETTYRSLLRSIKVSEDAETRRPDIHKVRTAAWGPRRSRAPPWGDSEWAVIASHIGRRTPKSNAWENFEIFQLAFQGAIHANRVTAPQVNSFGVHGRRMVASILANQASSNDLRLRSPELLKLGKELALTGLEGYVSSSFQMLATVLQLREPLLNDKAGLQALADELSAHRARLEARPRGYHEYAADQEVRRTEKMIHEVSLLQRGEAFHLQCPFCPTITIVQPRLMEQPPRCTRCGESLSDVSYVLWAMSGLFAGNSAGFYHPKEALPPPAEPAPTQAPALPAEATPRADAKATAALTSVRRHELLALLAVVREVRKNGRATTGQTETAYQAACQEFDEQPRGHTQFWKYLKALGSVSYLTSELSGKGQAGTTQILSVTPAIMAMEQDIELAIEA